MQEKIFIENLEPETFIETTFMVQSILVRKKKNGEDYISFQLKDKTGEIVAVMWDNVENARSTIEAGSIVSVIAKVGLYNDKPQLTVQRIVLVPEENVELEDYQPSTEKNIEKMWEELLAVMHSIGHLNIRRLLLELFDQKEFEAKFKKAPAAKSYHHSFLGGLLEHTLSIVKLSELIAQHYPEIIDRDLLLAGALLHDFAKIKELNYEKELDYSEEGHLLGHIVIGVLEVDKKMQEMSFPDKLRNKILHMIISHHGEEQYGSPKKPMTAEAIALHYIDNLDSRLQMYLEAVSAEKENSGSFTGYSRALERYLYKG